MGSDRVKKWDRLTLSEYDALSDTERREVFAYLYRTRHRDYKGVMADGRRSFMMYDDKNGGTVLVTEEARS